MGEIKFIRGTPRALYRSAISYFIDDFKKDPLNVGLLVPRPGMAMDVRSNLLRGMTVPTFCVTDLDDLTHYLFDQHEKVLHPVGGLALRNIIMSILLDNASSFPKLVRNGEVQEGILDDLYTLARTMRDFQVDLSRFRMDEIMGVDVPLFMSLYENKLQELGLVDGIGKRYVVSTNADRWTKERPFFRKLVILGGFEPTPSQLLVLRALVRGSVEVIYHHPFVPGHDRVFRQDILDLGGEMDPIDLPVGDDDLERLAAVRAWGDAAKVDLSDNVIRGRFLDPLSEARQVAQSVSGLLEQGVDPETIALFLPDRREALPLLREVLNDFRIPFKTDLGIPLSTSSAAQSAVGVLDAVAQGYTPPALVRMLSSPYLCWPMDGGNLWHVEVDRLARTAGVTVGRESWSICFGSLMDDMERDLVDPEVPDHRKRSIPRERERAKKVLSSLEQLFCELEPLEGDKPFQEHLRAFIAALGAMGFQDSMERSRWPDSEGEQWRAFSKLDGLLRGLENDGKAFSSDPVPLKDFVHALKREIGETSYYPGGRYDRAVNVAGYRSLSGRSFQHSFLLFTQEGDMPKLGVKHPFITSSQAKAMGLLAEEDMLRQERFYFLSAVLGGDKVSISYPAYGEGKRVLPSPFLMDMERNCLLGKMEELPITRSLRCAHMSLGASLTGKMAAGSEQWLPLCTISPPEMCRRLNVERLERSGGYHSEHDGVLSEASAEGLPGTRDKVFSATMLETYRKCPMSYFLRYVLHLRPLEGDDDSEALRVGNAAHRILFRFYRERLAQGKGMISPSEDLMSVKEQMRRIGEDVRNEFPLDSAESEASFLSLVGNEGTNGTLGRFIENQAQVDRPRWSPAYLEYGFGSRFSMERNDASSTEDAAVIPLSDEQNLLLRGKVDRVDVKDDNFLIIDYKTGEAPTYVSVARGYNMQMPLYLLACQQLLGKKPAGAAYYQLKNDDRFGMNLRIGSPSHKDELGGTPTAYRNGLTGDLELCRRNVMEVLEGISSGVFHPVDTNDGERCPSYCPYLRICRKDEMRVMLMSRYEEVE